MGFKNLFKKMELYSHIKQMEDDFEQKMSERILISDKSKQPLQKDFEIFCNHHNIKVKETGIELASDPISGDMVTTIRWASFHYPEHALIFKMNYG